MSENAISRADVIKTFINWCQKEFGYSDINREERFIDAINALPTVEPKRPKGEWILDGGTPICSVCHEEPCWSSEGYYFTDFCPNCGADMRGDK